MVFSHLFMKCYHGRYIFRFQDNVDSIWSTVHEIPPCSRPVPYGGCIFHLFMKWHHVCDLACSLTIAQTTQSNSTMD
jgi:hypothetical protein